MMDWLYRTLSAERLLDRRSNGGAIVLVRAAWIALLGYLATIIVREALDPTSTLSFSGSGFRAAAHSNLPAAGAFFAAAYAALYARFSSQWTYLAGVYNQIMAAKVRGPSAGELSQSALDAWEAGFIEDAQELHLARKPMFAGVIITMLERPGVRAKFERATAGGAARLAKLETDVTEAYNRAETQRRKRLGKVGSSEAITQVNADRDVPELPPN